MGESQSDSEKMLSDFNKMLIIALCNESEQTGITVKYENGEYKVHERNIRILKRLMSKFTVSSPYSYMDSALRVGLANMVHSVVMAKGFDVEDGYKSYTTLPEIVLEPDIRCKCVGDYRIIRISSECYYVLLPQGTVVSVVSRSSINLIQVLKQCEEIMYLSGAIDFTGLYGTFQDEADTKYRKLPVFTVTGEFITYTTIDGRVYLEAEEYGTIYDNEYAWNDVRNRAALYVACELLRTLPNTSGTVLSPEGSEGYCWNVLEDYFDTKEIKSAMEGCREFARILTAAGDKDVMKNLALFLKSVGY